MSDADHETIVACMHAFACVTASHSPQARNVHRYADFDDLSYLDFLTSAAAVAPALAASPDQRVGTQQVLEGVRRTRRVVATNSNLGMLLLLAPLAKAAAAPDLQAGLARVLAELDVEDSRLVYEAIRLAKPSGLGQVSQQDVKNEPTLPLQEIMSLAADRDLIARQYTIEFRDVFEGGALAILEGEKPERGSLEAAYYLRRIST